MKSLANSVFGTLVVEIMENPEQVLEDDTDEDDDSERGIDPTDHVRPVGLALLLLVLDGTDDEKHGVFTKTGSGSA